MNGHCRQARSGDIEPLAILWHNGWQDAHAAILPREVTEARTLDRFRDRISDGLSGIRVIEDAEGIAGLSYIKGDELYQFYVAERARGTGLARQLMADAYRQFAHLGVDCAWLACAIGNDRAARFYEKAGWDRSGIFVNVLDLPSGRFDLDVWRYERTIS